MRPVCRKYVSEGGISKIRGANYNIADSIDFSLHETVET